MTTAPGIELRRLGRSDVTVPRIALGCGNFGGVGSAPEFFGRGLSEPEAMRLMDAAWDAGLTHFDTADAYGGGRSEEMIGRWMRARGRLPLLTTKTFNPMTAGGDHGLSRARVERQLESSLERLGVDQVDLFLAHEFDPDTPLEETLGVLDDLVAAGKVRAHGVSNFNVSQLQAAIDTGATQCVQNSHSLLDRADQRGVLPLCDQRDVGYLVFGPLAGGWLTGKYRRGEPFPAGSRMSQRPEPYQSLVTDGVFDALDRLRELAAARSISMAGLAQAWLLADSRVTAVVVGPARPEHLEPVQEALDCALTSGERDELGRIFA